MFLWCLSMGYGNSGIARQFKTVKLASYDVKSPFSQLRRDLELRGCYSTGNTGFSLDEYFSPTNQDWWIEINLSGLQPIARHK